MQLAILLLMACVRNEYVAGIFEFPEVHVSIDEFCLSKLLKLSILLPILGLGLPLLFGFARLRNIKEQMAKESIDNVILAIVIAPAGMLPFFTVNFHFSSIMIEIFDGSLLLVNAYHVIHGVLDLEVWRIFQILRIVDLVLPIVFFGEVHSRLGENRCFFIPSLGLGHHVGTGTCRAATLYVL